ncbi:hypothetical protein SO694_000011158 [Aureococcus anophagefferens]|uniref:Uncharacterized protein n=1 Tax=Aureococcus anophagefferens TaxID=44056 RepID=A0ABR1GBP5_AURAN
MKCIITSVALCDDVSRARVPLALAAALVGALVAPPRPPARRTRLRSMREFRAAEVTLERFIGELGVVEVTDWEYSGELANPLDPAQPARTKRDFAADGPPVRLFLAAADDRARWRGRGHARPAFAEAWVANLGTEPPKVGASWLIFDWSGTATVANLCGPKTARGNPLYARRRRAGLRPAAARARLDVPPALFLRHAQARDDIFDRDIAKLRDYADAEEGWRNAVDLLDAKDGAGWDLSRRRNANDASRSGLSFLSARALPTTPSLSGDGRQYYRIIRAGND